MGACILRHFPSSSRVLEGAQSLAHLQESPIFAQSAFSRHSALLSGSMQALKPYIVPLIAMLLFAVWWLFIKPNLESERPEETGTPKQEAQSIPTNRR